MSLIVRRRIQRRREHGRERKQKTLNSFWSVWFSIADWKLQIMLSWPQCCVGTRSVAVEITPFLRFSFTAIIIGFRLESFLSILDSRAFIIALYKWFFRSRFFFRFVARFDHLPSPHFKEDWFFFFFVCTMFSRFSKCFVGAAIGVVFAIIWR